MRRLLRDRHRLALDEGTAERLLTGQLAPADAPPGYGRVAAVLAAASAPPDAKELAGTATALARFAAAARSRPLDPRPLTPRRSQVLTKLMTAKAAAAVLGVLMTGGVAAAATGNLPDPAQQAAHSLLGSVGVPAPADATAAAEANATGPDATGPAARGLCRAWSAGQGGQHGKKLDAVAFAALAKAAGGSDQVAAYCAKVTASTPADAGQQGSAPASTAAGQGHGSPPGSLPSGTEAGSGQGTPPSSLPADTAGGAGQGQGSPPSSVPPSTIRP
jgi:hypothetical protein